MSHRRKKEEKLANSLLDAVRHNDKRSILELIEKGADVNYTFDDGKTLLLHAISGQYQGRTTDLDSYVDLNPREDEDEDINYDYEETDWKYDTRIEAQEDVTNKMILIMLVLLIKAGADVNAADINGMTPLMSAAQSNRPSSVDKLVKAGADVNKTDNEGRTALMFSTEADELEREHYWKHVLKILIDAGADVSVTDKIGKTALNYSVEYDKKHLACTLIDAGADGNVIDRHAKAALLLYSTRMGNENVVQRLIKAGADLNITDTEDRTALMYAIQEHKESIACALLDAGADHSIIDNDGKSAFFFAGNEIMIQILTKAGADLNITDNQGKTALTCAVLDGRNDIATKLIKAGVDVNTTDNKGKTALIYSAQESNRSLTFGMISGNISAQRESDWDKIAKTLIKAGADVNITDDEGNTALMYAVENNCEHLVCERIDAGTNVNTIDKLGKSALIYAVQTEEFMHVYPDRANPSESIACKLVNAGAEVNVTDDKGKTPLMYAVQCNKKLLTKALIEARADVNVSDKNGKTALIYSLQNEHDKPEISALRMSDGVDHSESIACKLVKAGADVDVTDDKGKTPLIYAVQYNKKLLTNALIEARADLNVSDGSGKTALIHSLQNKHNKEEILALIKAGADVNISDHEGKTALFYGLAHEDITHALIEEGHATVNKRDRYGRSVLFYSLSESLELTHYLVEKGGDLNMKDSCNMSIISFCIDKLLDQKEGFSDDFGKLETLVEKLETLVKKQIQPHDTIFEAIINAVFCKIFHCNGLQNLMLKGRKRNAADAFFESRDIVEAMHTTEKGRERTAGQILFEARNIVEAMHTVKKFAEQTKKEKIDQITKIMKEGRYLYTNLQKIADLLVELGANPSYADAEGNTALHYATCLPLVGTYEDTAAMTMCQKLENLGLSISARNYQYQTPLLFCLSKKEWINTSHGSSKVKTLVEVCKFLLAHESSAEETTRNGKTVFHLILELFQEGLHLNDGKIAEEVLAQIMELLELFPSSKAFTEMTVNKRDTNLNSPLHLWAMLEFHSSSKRDSSIEHDTFKKNLFGAIFKHLVACGAKLNDRNKKDEMPIHLCRSWTAVKLLIDAGADPKVLDSEGSSPLLVASKKISFRGNDHLYQDVSEEPKAFWKTALDHTLDPWAVDNHGTSVLSILIQENAFDLPKALVEVACEENCIQSDTIAVSLLNAVCQDSSTRKQWKSILVEMILKSRKAQNYLSFGNNEDTPLHLCCKNIVNHSEESFSYSRFEFHTSENSEQTSVHWTIAKQLLSYGMDCNVLDASGQSCLDIAKKCPSLKSYLLKPLDIDEVPLALPWTSISTKYKPILSKVARQQECKQIDSYWYHKTNIQKGSFGLVFAGMNEKDGREVAIKRIEKLRIQQLEADKKEITTLTALADCEQVVRYLSFTEDEHFCYVILELMEGNLNEYLDGDAFDSTRSVQLLCGDVLSGLTYLHQQNILHRDLKPSNILFKTYPKLCLKIADFGLSRRIDTLGTYTTSSGSVVGTRCWIAPEVLKCSSKKTKHQKACDVFSAGLVIHYILSGKKHPFTPADCANKSELQISNETEANVINGKMEGLGNALSPEAANLVQIMLDSDPLKRPTAAMTLKHPFFWSETKKMDFLSSVGNQPDFEYSRAKKHKEALPFTSVECELDGKLKSIILAHPTWDDANYVHMPAIYTEMTKKRKPYNTSSVVELVRFIRNTRAHISEDKRPTLVRKLVLEDFVFLEYFPNLVVEVFQCIMMHGWNSREEIKNRLS